MLPWDDRYLTVDGLRLHYLDWGNPEAEPILYLHGLRSHAHTFDPFAAILRPYFQVLALDQRGHGESGWAQDYSELGFVSDVQRFVEALALPPFALVGHSMGARNAWAYAARQPERLRRLVLVDLGPEVERQGLERMPGNPAPQVFASVQEAFDFLRGANPGPSDDMVRLRVLHNLNRLPNGHWIWRWDPALRDWPRSEDDERPPEDGWGALARIACDTLVVRGQKSDLLSPQVAERMVGTLPRGRLVTISGAGHTVPADRPEEFARALLEFLTEKPAGGSR